MNIEGYVLSNEVNAHSYFECAQSNFRFSQVYSLCNINMSLFVAGETPMDRAGAHVKAPAKVSALFVHPTTRRDAKTLY